MSASLSPIKKLEAWTRRDYDALAADMALHGYPPAFCDLVRRWKNVGAKRSDKTNDGIRFLTTYWDWCDAAVDADTDQKDEFRYALEAELDVDDGFSLALIGGNYPRVTDYVDEIRDAKRQFGVPYPWEPSLK